MKEPHGSGDPRKPPSRTAKEAGGTRTNKRAAARDAAFERLWNEATAAGDAAFHAFDPAPVTVTTVGASAISVISDYHSYEWIAVTPGTSSFARWLVRTGRASRHHTGGVSWIHSRGSRGGADTAAFVAVLTYAGVTASSWSVLD